MNDTNNVSVKDLNSLEVIQALEVFQSSIDKKVSGRFTDENVFLLDLYDGRHCLLSIYFDLSNEIAVNFSAEVNEFKQYVERSRVGI